MNEGTTLALAYRKAPNADNASKLVVHFHRLACEIINRRWGSDHPDFDAMLQEAYLSILNAAAIRFDEDKGTEFSTYVYHRITSAVNEEGAKSTGVPWGTLRRYRRAMRATDGDAVEAEARASEFGLSAAGFLVIHAIVNPIELPDLPSASSLESSIIDAEMVELILGQLPPKDRQLFRMYHGIDDGCRRTADEMAALTGETAQEIRNRIARIRRQLVKIARTAYKETDHPNR